MFDSSLMGELELINVTPNAQTKRECSISDSKSVFSISAQLGRDLGWNDVERVNLYRAGSTFVLKPDKVGLMKVVKVTKGSESRKICNKNFCIEVLSRCRSARKFDGWAEGDNPKMLFFKPKEGEK